MPLWSARPSAFDPSLRICGFARRIFSVAPKEQNVYSPHIPLTLPAPLGAECKLTPACTLRSAGAQSHFRLSGYKHRAPLEHFARISIQTTFRAKPVSALNILSTNDLLVPERYQWIYLRRATCRYVTGDQRDEQQHQRNRAEGYGIIFTNAKQQTSH